MKNLGLAGSVRFEMYDEMYNYDMAGWKERLATLSTKRYFIQRLKGGLWKI